MRKLFSILFLAVLVLIGSASVASAQQNKTWDLGVYPGGTYVNPDAINNSGIVVGYGDVPPNGYTHPLGVPLFGPNAGKWFDLGTLGGEGTYDVEASAVADNGMIVGYTWITGDSYPQAFAWTPKGGMVDLGGLGATGTLASFANNINKSGTLIVGTAYDANGNGFGVVWTPTVVWNKGVPTTTWHIQELPTESGTIISGINYFALGVNNSGQIVGGTCCDPSTTETPVIWNPVRGGKWTIATLPLSVDYPNGNVTNINDYGQIAGGVWTFSPSLLIAPALWEKIPPSQNTWKLIVLATPSGSVETFTTGINDLGDVVGYGYGETFGPLGEYWSTKNPNAFHLLNFPEASSPGAWCVGLGVNDLRIAVGVFPNNALGTLDGFAVQLSH
jgi:probable HAF family extracellular repeat protein